jgi:hypothetical protein
LRNDLTLILDEPHVEVRSWVVVDELAIDPPFEPGTDDAYVDVVVTTPNMDGEIRCSFYADPGDVNAIAELSADRLQDELWEIAWLDGTGVYWPTCSIDAHEHPMELKQVHGELWWRCPSTGREVSTFGTLRPIAS